MEDAKARVDGRGGSSKGRAATCSNNTKVDGNVGYGVKGGINIKMSVKRGSSQPPLSPTLRPRPQLSRQCLQIRPQLLVEPRRRLEIRHCPLEHVQEASYVCLLLVCLVDVGLELRMQLGVGFVDLREGGREGVASAGPRHQPIMTAHSCSPLLAQPRAWLLAPSAQVLLEHEGPLRCPGPLCDGAGQDVCGQLLSPRLSLSFASRLTRAQLTSKHPSSRHSPSPAPYQPSYPPQQPIAAAPSVGPPARTLRRVAPPRA